ncbi:energy transducer TonB [Belliella kenyensis]|uniref:Energy transducer TonB n=1 Tax=Belliella kenyensis TaxID=1472724 RepID=A0ABV8EMS1_9BACT|nr:energy transducer TonB [Belliella kenyensis]MCH7401524.1 energy transducer TonB [Belliella kenyensis]MDN3603196.1 energy transducer TonB [Belliella kenyensis]
MRKAIFKVLMLFVSMSALAQSKVAIPLNEHFYPLGQGAGQHVYNMEESIASDSKKTYKIYSLEGVLVKESRSSFLKIDGESVSYEEEKLYDSSGMLDFTRLEIKGIKTNQVKILVDNEIVSEIKCEGDCSGYVILPDGEKLLIDRDIFKPSFTDQNVFDLWLREVLTYPLIARRKGAQGDVWVGAEIDESGQLVQYKIMNNLSVDKSLIDEVNRVLRKYKGGFIPAKNLKGETIQAWMYFPVKFRLG